MKLFMRNEWLQLRLLMMRRLLLLLLLLPLPLPLLLMPVAADASVAATNTTCKHATNMWGDPNPNIFYVCSVADQSRPLQLHCPEGRGFFNGLGHLGCLPYDQWPACRPSSTAAQLRDSCGTMDTMDQQPWPSLDPNRFYMCPGVNATPLLLNCAPGKGFLQTVQSVGCADWSHWRQQMQCEAYF